MNKTDFLKLEKPGVKDFLELDHHEKYDFTDVIEGEYTEKHGIDKYVLYKLSAIKNMNEWYYKGKICYPKAADKWQELNGNGILSQVGEDPDIFSKDQNSRHQLLRCIYEQLWGKECLANCSDTMNSVQTTFNQLLVCYYKEKKIYKSRATLKYIIALYYENELDKEHLHDVEALMDVYHTIGNYMPVPNGVNTWKASVFKDYFDLFLAFIYNYYNAKNILARNEYFGIRLKGTILEEFDEWLESFGNWDSFVEKNYLQHFVEKNTDGTYGEPKELWEGHFGGSVLPDTSDKCNAYFENAHERILARGKLMVEALKKKAKGNSEE